MTNAFKAAKCPECGGDIQVPTDRDSVKCMYCGKDIIVRQSIQASAGPNVQNWMRLAAAAEEADNHDEAYDYFTRVLEVESENHEAWLGKAAAAGWGSNLNRDRYTELLAGIQRAVEYAPDAQLDEMLKRGAETARAIIAGNFDLSNNFTWQHIALGDTWTEHVGRCFAMLPVLSFANTLDPTNKEVVKDCIDIAKSLIDGVHYEDVYNPYDNGFPRMKTERLTANQEAQAQKTMNEFVAKMRAMDATYQAPEIQKAGKTGPVAAILITVFCLGMFVVLLWLGAH